MVYFQACYGILKVPEGSWLCRICALGVHQPKCLLCPKKGGAMKPTRSATKWVHVSCALWIPEVRTHTHTHTHPECELYPVHPRGTHTQVPIHTYTHHTRTQLHTHTLNVSCTLCIPEAYTHTIS